MEERETKMNECGKEKETTPSTGGLEATQELKDYLGTLKCPICGSGKLVFGTKAFNEDLGKLTGAAQGAASGPVGAFLGRMTGGHSRKMVLEVGCVECGLIESLQDWKNAKPFDFGSDEDAEELEGLRLKFNELAGRSPKDKNEKQSIKEERERIKKEMNTLQYKLNQKAGRT